MRGEKTQSEARCPPQACSCNLQTGGLHKSPRVHSKSAVSDSSRPHGLKPTRLLCPWDSPGNNTGVGCHALLQGVFLTQGSNPSLPNRQVDSSPSELRGKPHACHLLKLKVAGKVPGHSWLLTGREHSSPHPLQITAKYQLQTEIYFNYGIKIGTIKTSHP